MKVAERTLYRCFDDIGNPLVVHALLMPPTPALREALNGSITSGHFADTKIYLFSHRNSSGDVCKPKILYANSGVLRSVPYFNDRGSPQLGPISIYSFQTLTSILWKLLRDSHKRS
jgi:hypothetical protein